MSHEVVISGISGQFPECWNVDEFKSKLFAKEVLLRHEKSTWDESPAERKYPTFAGKLPEWKTFDDSFFGMPPKLAHNCDPYKGIMLERTFEAILDSGNNPFDLKGHYIGVVTGNSISEAEITRFAEGSYLEGNGMVGHARTMQANRVSYFFNFTGPSYNCDNSAGSAISALEMARSMVADGSVEAAVVGSVNLLSLNAVNTEYEQLNFFSPSGKCFPFDEKAEGLVRSEGAVVFFLQRAQDAKRNYCTVVKAKDCYLGDRLCGYVTCDSTYDRFLKNYYGNERLDPNEVCYVEANSCAHKELDALELNAIADTFHRTKDAPLLIGSVAGNAGYGDAVAGFFSMIKSIIALESNMIPATINYTTPNSRVPALLNGSLKPVTEHTPLKGDTIAVTNVNIFGSVDHVVLKRHTKTKKTLCVGDLPEDGLHRLVTFQARHEQGANQTMREISSMAVDTDFVSLVNDAFKTNIPAYIWRGYTLLPLEKSSLQHVAQVDSTKRPLWYIFSGMGSQYVGMGQDLLKFPVFAAAIEKCDRVLRPKGIDIREIITTSDPAVFDNILYCFVGIAAIQIGLLDMLRLIGMSPDGMIGHSVGELGCAYADECFTAEETILCAYARGKASLESPVIRGMMAAVGLGFNDIKDKIPATVDVACHNSADSCTLSGPTDDVNKYVEQLQKEKVFARAVSAGGIAYHSRYIRPVAPRLLEYLKEILPSPKPRSSKWISSSAPESQWGTNEAKLCSAEYHTNNLLSPVLFQEACSHLPENAIVVEIAPRGLLQAILKRALGSNLIVLSLTERNAQSNVINLLNTLGHLYVNGVDINVNSLFPTVEYPVARNTPGLAKLVTWNHEEPAYVELTQRVTWMLNRGKKTKYMEISSDSPEYEEWKNLTINKQPHMPLSCLLMYPWQMIFCTNQLKLNENSVVLENVIIKHLLPVRDDGTTVVVTFARVSSNFEISVMNENETFENFVVGRLFGTEAVYFELPTTQEDSSNLEELNKKDVYSILERFNYELGSECQYIESLLLGETECRATLVWNGELKWFIDALLHFVMIVQTDKSQKLMLPTCWNKMQINTPELTKLAKGTEIQVHYNLRCNRVVCEYAEVLGLILSQATVSQPPKLAWREVKLQPYMDTKLSETDFLSISFQLTVETNFLSWSKSVVPIEVLVVGSEKQDNAQFISKIKKAHLFVSKIEIRVSEVDSDSAKKALSVIGQQCHLVAGEYNTLCQLALNEEINNIYFLAYVNSNNGLKPCKAMRPILTFVEGKEYSLVLLRKETPVKKLKPLEAKANEWLAKLKQWLDEDTSDSTVVLYTHELNPNDILPVLSREPCAHRVRTVFVEDKEAPPFNLNSSLYSSQLSLGLPVNILSGKVWNSRRAFELELKPHTITLDNFLNSRQLDEVSIRFIGLNTTFLVNQENYVEDLTSYTDVELVDYSGWSDGQKVMGLAQYDTKRNKVTSDSTLKWQIPEFWTMEDAVTVPVTYSLAFYCLFLEGKLNKGETILVNAKMSLLAQAVINIALHLGAEVFASVQDDDEAITLHKMFPALNCDNVVVLDRQNLKDRIRKLTRGQGVDLIINSHNGKLLQDAVSLSASFGRFVHLSCSKIGSGDAIGLSTFFKNNYVKSVNINTIANSDEECKRKLQEAIKAGVDHGIISPFQRKVFTPSQQSDALRNLQLDDSKKTIISAKELQLRKEPTDILDSIQVIVSEDNTEFLLDLAEWMVERGCRKLIVLTGDDEMNDYHLRRFAKLVDSKQVFVAFASTNRLDTHQNSTSFFKELLHVATITSIFCIGLDEDGLVMKNIDSASRELLPQLNDFVSLLGTGSNVGESRSSSGLPIVSIQNQGPPLSPECILPYLAAILNDSQPNQARFLLVEDKVSSAVKPEIVDYSSFLPSNITDLLEIGTEIKDTISFSIVPTLSPGYRHVCQTLLPVFVVPGLSYDYMRPLVQQFIHPAYSCSLLSSLNSLQQQAECLLKEIEKIQPRGRYNIICESWSGVVAFTLSCLLEARGHLVDLILIEGVPSTLQDRIKTLCNTFGKDLEISLISALFNLPKVATSLTQVRRIDEVLQSTMSEMSAECQVSATRAASAIHSLLHNVSCYQSSSCVFKGNLTVISHRPLSHTDTSSLYQICAKAPKVIITYDETYQKMIASPATAAIINENISFSWHM